MKEIKCNKCLELKSQSHFSKDKYSQTLHKYTCKICMHKIDKSKRQLNLERYHRYDRNARLLSIYNITHKDYLKMYRDQEGNCRICRKHFDKLFIDHIHGTKTIRGLLCMHCNLLIGHAKESPGILLNARMYIN